MADLAVANFSALLSLTDEEAVAKVLAGQTGMFEIIMRRYNQRLYRIARAILRDDAQAEDVMQAAYVHAYEHLAQFSGRASFGAWLSRIAANEALGRLRGAKRFDQADGEGDRMDCFASTAADPEQAAATAETGRLLQTLIESLPTGNRAVFILRDVEGMSTTDVSTTLGISLASVRVRLHRARTMLRKGLSDYARRGTRAAYAFHAIRCDRVVGNVFAIIQLRHGTK